MKSLLTLGLIFFAFSFCGLGDKLKGLSGGTSGGNSNTASSGNSSGSSTSSSSAAEKPKLTASQQAIVDGGTETKWDDQGLSWKLPASWKKMDVKKESFNYQSPDNAFLLVNISVMPDSFPMDTSLKAYHDQALQQLKNGKYESVKLVEIDGIESIKPRQKMTARVTFADGTVKNVPILCRIDTLDELDYFKNGGILQYVLRDLAA